MKKFLATLLMAGLVFGLVACGGSDSEETSTEAQTEDTAADTESADTEAAGDADDSDITIGVVCKTKSSEYWNYIIAGLEQAEIDFGVNVEIQGPPTQTSYTEWNNMTETMLGTGNMDAMILAPLQPEGLDPIIGDTEVPILLFDTDAPDYDGHDTFIGTDQYDAAYMLGEYAAKQAGEGAKAVILSIIEGNPTSDARDAGYKDALEAGGVEIIALQHVEGMADQATDAMENIITAHNGKFDIVCNGNDESAIGASRAIADAGLTGEVINIGFDGIRAGLQGIIDGTITATAAVSGYDMGYIAIETAIEAAKGEIIDEFVPVEAALITAENAQESLDALDAIIPPGN